MFRWIAHRLTALMWRKLGNFKELENAGPVMLTWKKANGRVRHRVGVWHSARTYAGQEFGSGFTCYWSGVPLTDTMTHWAPLPMTPNL